MEAKDIVHLIDYNFFLICQVALNIEVSWYQPRLIT